MYICSVVLGYQLVFRAVDDRVLAPDAARRRAYASVLARVGRPAGLFGFGLADSHGHVCLACSEAAAGRFAHDARLALKAALDLPILRAHVTPIRDAWHASNLLRYVHRQDAHHGAGLDPLREGTSLPDIFGLRPYESWLADRVRQVVPRVTRAALLGHWGLLELTEGVDLATLAESGAAAVGVGALRGRDARVVAARGACVHAAMSASTTTLANALEVTTRTVRTLRATPPDPRLVRAVRLQMGLRALIDVGNPLLGEPVGRRMTKEEGARFERGP